jgi:hypothetical protein
MRTRLPNRPFPRTRALDGAGHRLCARSLGSGMRLSLFITLLRQLQAATLFA